MLYLAQRKEKSTENDSLCSLLKNSVDFSPVANSLLESTQSLIGSEESGQAESVTDHRVR